MERRIFLTAGFPSVVRSRRLSSHGKIGSNRALRRMGNEGVGEGEVPRAAGKVAWTSSYWRTGKIYSERISLRVERSNVILLEQKKRKEKERFSSEKIAK